MLTEVFLVKHLEGLVRLQNVLNDHQMVITRGTGPAVEVSVPLAVILLTLDTVKPELCR